MVRPLPALMVCAGLTLCFLPGLALLRAQQKSIDAERSTLTIRVYKAGLFSAFAHNHEIRARIAEGQLSEENPAAIQFKVIAKSLEVVDPEESAKDRAEIQMHMQNEVLESERFPEIAFHSTSVGKMGPDRWTVKGDLTLHGQTHPLELTVTGGNKRYTGAVNLKQSDFGIKPFSAAGGTVKVKDIVKVEFAIEARDLPPAGSG
jgi:hypothetical protein